MQSSPWPLRHIPGRQSVVRQLASHAPAILLHTSHYTRSSRRIQTRHSQLKHTIGKCG